jgi:hypothetical protein
MNEDINKAVEALQWKDAKQTMDLDKLAEIRINHQNDMAINSQKQRYEIINEANKQQNAIELEQQKKLLGNSAYNEGAPTGAEIATYNEKQDAAEQFDAEKENKVFAETQKITGSPNIPTAATVAEWEADPTDVDNRANLKAYKDAQAKVYAENTKAYVEANTAAVNADQYPIYWNQITPSMLESYEASLGGTKEKAYNSIIVEIASKRGFSEEQVHGFADTLPNVNKTQSIYQQLDDYVAKQPKTK